MAERRGHKRVRGIAVRVAVVLLLGAVVNVAVAWGFGLAHPVRMTLAGGGALPTTPPPLTTVPTAWYAWIDEQAGATDVLLRCREAESIYQAYVIVVPWTLTDPLEIHRGTFILPGQLNGPTPAFAQPRDDYLFATHPAMDCLSAARGWPWLALSAQVRGHLHTGSVLEQKGAALGMMTYPGRVLPLSPIWPGFAINTVFYAAILWLLFAGPGRVRRWRRIRRGLCAKCAYPVGTSDVCTECGVQISKKIRGRGSMGLPLPTTPAAESEPNT